jgi:integrase
MATEQIRVHVVRYANSKNLIMRYRCPLTGKQVNRSTKTTKQREAERIAAKWEAELREGRYQRGSKMSWEEFREVFETEASAGKRGTTALNSAATFNAFEYLTKPQRLAELTTAKVAAFARELRKPYTITRGKGKKQTSREAVRTEATVSRHMRALRAIARWAHRQGLLAQLPSFEMPTGTGRMKGRPVTGEEFDRLLIVVEKIVGAMAVESWKLLLRGYWTSGLRLSEGLNLRWDQKPGGVWVILNGKKSVLAFDADSQKSGKVQLVPMAPEFVELLEPLKRTSGFVFSPLGFDGQPLRRDKDLVGATIREIGKAAGIVVDPERGKYASAHDLRRSFGHRWSRRVMPPVLKELMRHCDISTTMKYYIGQSAESTAAELWQAVGTTLGTQEATATSQTL